MSKREHSGWLLSVVALIAPTWGCGENRELSNTADWQASDGASVSGDDAAESSATGATPATSDAASGPNMPVDSEVTGNSASSTPIASDVAPQQPERQAEGGAGGAPGLAATGGASGEAAASSSGGQTPSIDAGAGGDSNVETDPPNDGTQADCTAGPWEPSDPYATGPFEVATDNEVGPEAGEPEEDGTVPRFTMFRPADIEQSALCHPVITWGNGTGSTPNLYGTFLRHFASHGFVVIGSNSTNVSRGDPRPMNVGIDWVLEQNEDPTSVLYQRIDASRIGATGHSQGAAATSQASGDQRIVASVPIEGGGVQRELNGPAMFFCGGMDDIVSCDGAQRALEAITTLPAMYANYLTATHGNWLSRTGNQRSDVEAAVTAWMRVHLMDDESLRSWFYGASCELCTDSAWEIERKNMDQ